MHRAHAQSGIRAVRASGLNSPSSLSAYMAPEVITRAKGEGHGRAADIWSLGCVLIEMVTGKVPNISITSGNSLAPWRNSNDTLVCM